MTDITNIDDYRKSKDGWLSGFAKCLHCGQKWVAVKECNDNIWLECPNCGTMKGCFIHPVEREGEHWTCQCGCDVFYLTRLGPYCCACGIWHDDYLRTIE